MSNYDFIYENLKEFYRVNDDLRNDLNNFCIECHGITLDEFFKAYAKSSSESDNVQTYIDELKYLNEEPHSITEQEIMYELIEIFDFQEVKQ